MGTGSSKRILFVASCWPLGGTYGGQLRAFHTAQALSAVGRVTFLVVGSEAENGFAAAETATTFATLPPICAHPTHDNRWVRKVRRLLDPNFLGVHGVGASAADIGRVLAYRENFDLVWVLNARTPNILSIWDWRQAHLDIDDIPSTYFRTVAQNASTTGARLKARVERRLMKRRDVMLTKRFATLSVCSEPDRRYLGSQQRIHVIPNGYAKPDKEPQRAVDPAHPRIGFIGLYSYRPNLDGVRWFLTHCWQDLRKAIPGIRLRLVGKDSDGPLRPTEPDIDALGWVADPAPEIATWSAMIVPIRFGGGTRIKIAEAFSRKCPAVSTSVGAFGYEVEHERHLLLADDPKAFSAACIRLVCNPADGQKLAREAWTAFQKRWSWDAISAKVVTAAEDCLRLKSG